MDSTDVGTGLGALVPGVGYNKPRLERLGTFRELTKCGNYSYWELLLQRHGVDVDICALKGSSSYTWQR